MVRLGKLTDYGLVLMTCIGRTEGVAFRTARDPGHRVQAPHLHRQQAPQTASREWVVGCRTGA